MDSFSIVFPPEVVYDPVAVNRYSSDGSPSLWPHVQARIIERAKQVVCQMHMYATHLMDNYDDPYVNIETNEELGVKLRFRMIVGCVSGS
jgi:hypothetical protein